MTHSHSHSVPPLSLDVPSAGHKHHHLPHFSKANFRVDRHYLLRSRRSNTVPCRPLHYCALPMYRATTPRPHADAAAGSGDSIHGWGRNNGAPFGHHVCQHSEAFLGLPAGQGQSCRAGQSVHDGVQCTGRSPRVREEGSVRVGGGRRKGRGAEEAKEKGKTKPMSCITGLSFHEKNTVVEGSLASLSDLVERHVTEYWESIWSTLQTPNPLVAPFSSSFYPSYFQPTTLSSRRVRRPNG